MCPTCLDRVKKIEHFSVTLTDFLVWFWKKFVLWLRRVITLSLARILWHIQHLQFLPSWQHFDLQVHVTPRKTFMRFGSSCCLFPFFLIKMIMPSHRVWFAALDVILNFLKFFCCVVLPYLKNANRNSVLKWTALLQNLWSLPAISVKS